ncbi:hypothetical protein FEM48_Zijuj08G0096600 [Ziziphus jujuba var. spinosa]|uniref:AAA+ ATPase domain-containing protein n=1 Tax=Ziziphus jujuba var. spinosa TaxID=714518 RepID=A0A978UYC8_ZIZJJ|nr:hypothetical protein FEM48_Zijuj08G0096600 [Ziziphus jujuba var. spinosa]
MFSLKDIPTSPSALFAAYASFSASMMLIRSMVNDIVPYELRVYLSLALRSIFNPLSSDLTLLVDEYCSMTRNQVFDAAEVYLRTKISPSTDRLRVSQTPKQKSLTFSIDKGQEVTDTFQNIRIKWRFVCTEPDKNTHSREKRFFNITFKKKFKDVVMESYLPYVLVRAKAIKQEDKVLKLYNRDCPSLSKYCDDGYEGTWGSVNLEHPATFDTLAMEPELKKEIMEDLDRFVRRRDFYKKVGKAWKRGYLLYGPPGTGKSSLIAAMANYLKFDIYDLELTSIYSNSDLRRVLLSTTNRSILVIEDIDCSIEMQNRQDNDHFDASYSGLTLSGILNFIDGLWSSCGDERVIVFTTNHKDRLDPALLRPGRMDMHINMSYCTSNGFKILASNYLGVHGNQHHLCGEIESIVDSMEVTPAEIAEELMKNDDADVALTGLVNFLKRKKIEIDENKKAEESAKSGVEGEATEPQNQIAKRQKIDDNNVKRIERIVRNFRRPIVRGRRRSFQRFGFMRQKYLSY